MLLAFSSNRSRLLLLTNLYQLIYINPSLLIIHTSYYQVLFFFSDLIINFTFPNNKSIIEHKIKIRISIIVIWITPFYWFFVFFHYFGLIFDFNIFFYFFVVIILNHIMSITKIILRSPFIILSLLCFFTTILFIMLMMLFFLLIERINVWFFKNSLSLFFVLNRWLYFHFNKFSFFLELRIDPLWWNWSCRSWWVSLLLLFLLLFDWLLFN